MTTPPRTYPPGVPAWIDSERADPHGAAEFYAALFGWTFVEAAPPGGSGPYLIATLDGGEVAAIGPVSGAGVAWNTYVAVDDVVATITRVAESGGIAGPPTMGPRSGERI